jgi:hypothetical protein
VGSLSYVVELALKQREGDRARGKRGHGPRLRAQADYQACVPSRSVPDCDRSVAGLEDELDDAPPVGREFTLLRLIRKRGA